MGLQELNFAANASRESYDHVSDVARVVDSDNTDSSSFNNEPVRSVSADSGKDKGWAWVIAVCGMLAISVTFGANGAYGVFLAHYLSEDVFGNATDIDYAFIGGLVFCFGQILCPVIALSIDIFGSQVLILFGLVIHVVGYILASFSTKTWQLYFTQGVMPGIAVAFVFLTVTMVLPSWFDKYLSSGMGIVVAGAGFGGFITSLYVNALIKSTGDQKWALRTVAIVGFVVLLISSFILIPQNHKRIPFKEVTSKYLSTKFKKQFNLSVFKSYPLVLLAAWFGITYMGYVLLLFTLTPYARKVGLSPTQGTVITTILNVFQMIGRPSMGLLGDRLGRFNLASLINIVIIVLIFAFWMNATSYGSLIAFAIISGLLIGVTPTMGQSLAANILQDPEKLPAAWSGLNVVSGILTLFAEVIALAIVDNDSSKPYLHTQIFAGCCYAVSLVCLLLIREWIVRRNLKAIETIDSDSIQEAEEKQHTLPRLVWNSISSVIVRMFYPMKV